VKHEKQRYIITMITPLGIFESTPATDDDGKIAKIIYAFEHGGLKYLDLPSPSGKFNIIPAELLKQSVMQLTLVKNEESTTKEKEQETLVSKSVQFDTSQPSGNS